MSYEVVKYISLFLGGGELSPHAILIMYHVLPDPRSSSNTINRTFFIEKLLYI